MLGHDLKLGTLMVIGEGVPTWQPLDWTAFHGRNWLDIHGCTSTRGVVVVIGFDPIEAGQSGIAYGWIMHDGALKLIDLGNLKGLKQ